MAGKTAAVKRRLKEPSTWAGVALALGMGHQAWQTGDMASVGAALGGLLAMLLPEGSAEVSQAKPTGRPDPR